MREADSSPDGPFRHSRSRSKRAPCHHLIRPFLLIPQPPLHARRHVRNAHLTCPTTRKQHGREWSKSSIIPVLQDSPFWNFPNVLPIYIFFLSFTACALFFWTPWIPQKHKCSWLEMHLGQVVCLLHLSVLSPFYHHVEMAEGAAWGGPLFLSI